MTTAKTINEAAGINAMWLYVVAASLHQNTLGLMLVLQENFVFFNID